MKARTAKLAVVRLCKLITMSSAGMCATLQRHNVESFTILTMRNKHASKWNLTVNLSLCNDEEDMFGIVSAKKQLTQKQLAEAIDKHMTEGIGIVNLASNGNARRSVKRKQEINDVDMQKKIETMMKIVKDCDVVKQTNSKHIRGHNYEYKFLIKQHYSIDDQIFDEIINDHCFKQKVKRKPRGVRFTRCMKDSRQKWFTRLLSMALKINRAQKLLKRVIISSGDDVMTTKLKAIQDVLTERGIIYVRDHEYVGNSKCRSHFMIKQGYVIDNNIFEEIINDPYFKVRMPRKPRGRRFSRTIRNSRRWWFMQLLSGALQLKRTEHMLNRAMITSSKNRIKQ